MLQVLVDVVHFQVVAVGLIVLTPGANVVVYILVWNHSHEDAR